MIPRVLKIAAAISVALMVPAAQAGVSAAEAATLKTTLTPFGAERAGNKDGTIPAWTGAPTPGTDLDSKGRLNDPFANEKPLYSVTAKNMNQYADKLTEGSKALLKKFPDSFRIDVYPTHRTAIAPQWVYDNTAKNAVNGKLVDSPSGPIPTGVYGGIPFPIPTNGLEVLWNHQLHWRGTAAQASTSTFQVTTDGKWIMMSDVQVTATYPYYVKDGADQYHGDYYLIREKTLGPSMRAGEGLVIHFAVEDDKTNSWVYLTGQRRIRRLPNPCCDTPATMSSGISTFDEVSVFAGRTGLFDWKLVGKKEILVPYNSNRFFTPTKSSDVQGPKHLNPDWVRWELHRVWVVDATLKPGARHTSPKSRYYFDEDTWAALMAERYDAQGTLARVPFMIPAVLPDFPVTDELAWGIYDLIGGSTFVAGFGQERARPEFPLPSQRESLFTPDVLAGEGVR